eukprot:TRINITY_DN10775_c0_g1_i3.p1 TRINITY_DN10775_c0_g1~~TRINITY_DN10775_c0_g1_i3.p1  ORF type:complete len:324 (+),score=64.68 TRINITY_DN10775_c0_g1_i3:76-1047(+)
MGLTRLYLLASAAACCVGEDEACRGASPGEDLGGALRAVQQAFAAVASTADAIAADVAEVQAWAAEALCLTPVPGARILRYRQAASAVFLVDLLVFIVAYAHKDIAAVFRRMHKKFPAHGTNWALGLHAAAGLSEMALGWYCFWAPDAAWPRMVCGLIAVCAHIPTNLVMAPGVWGLPYITVSGYVAVGLLRFYKAALVLAHPTLARHEESWILLHTATLVRLYSFAVVPFTSVDGPLGDLVTEPVIHTLSVSAAVLVTLPFVFPAELGFFLVLGMAVLRRVYPPRVYPGRLTATAGAQKCAPGGAELGHRDAEPRARSIERQ